METNTRSDQVVLLLDGDSRDGENLYASIKDSGYDCKAVVIEDDGFLPDGFVSVYEFFLGDFMGNVNVKGSPKYFNQIRVPEYWEISGTSSRGSINNLSHERGRIFYAEPRHKRLVKVVDWLDERGVVRVSDHYNKYGALYARTSFNAKEQKVNKAYFDAEGHEIIVENYVTGDIILDDGQVRIFRSKTDFVRYFLEKTGLSSNRIFFNSLSTPFFVSQRLHGADRRDVLFWQEPARNDIPGNMQVILRGESTRTCAVMVQHRAAYDKLIELGANADMVKRLGFIYRFERENGHGHDALICTNSDRIEQLKALIESLPEIHFHIAALTEMSSKLMQTGTYDNVSLYPGVKMSVLEDLFKKCDLYLDINHESEIVSAVYKAFLNNQLIFTFTGTMHSPDFVPAEHRYSSENVAGMITDIKATLISGAEFDRRLAAQREFAMAEGKDSYTGVLG
jgi:accessory Sec system glycosyltransferase GtfB